MPEAGGEPATTRGSSGGGLAAPEVVPGTAGRRRAPDSFARHRTQAQSASKGASQWRQAGARRNKRQRPHREPLGGGWARPHEAWPESEPEAPPSAQAAGGAEALRAGSGQHDERLVAQLHIDSLSSEDNGLYRCRVDFRRARSRIEEVELRIIGEYWGALIGLIGARCARDEHQANVPPPRAQSINLRTQNGRQSARRAADNP